MALFNEPEERDQKRLLVFYDQLNKLKENLRVKDPVKCRRAVRTLGKIFRRLSLQYTNHVEKALKSINNYKSSHPENTAEIKKIYNEMNIYHNDILLLISINRGELYGIFPNDVRRNPVDWEKASRKISELEKDVKAFVALQVDSNLKTHSFFEHVRRFPEQTPKEEIEQTQEKLRSIKLYLERAIPGYIDNLNALVTPVNKKVREVFNKNNKQLIGFLEYARRYAKGWEISNFINNDGGGYQRYIIRIDHNKVFVYLYGASESKHTNMEIFYKDHKWYIQISLDDETRNAFFFSDLMGNSSMYELNGKLEAITKAIIDQIKIIIPNSEVIWSTDVREDIRNLSSQLRNVVLQSQTQKKGFFARFFGG